MDYLTFRSGALQNITLLKGKERQRFQLMTKDEIEAWIKSEYERHYGKGAV